MSGIGAATTADAIAIDPDFCAGLFTQLLSFSRDEPGVTRAAYGEGEERAHALMRATGLSLGLTPETDAAGNLFLTLPGKDPALPAWMVGSHVDTVPHGGNFDGAAGVIGGLAAVRALRRSGLVPARPVTVAVFRAEESVWFPASYVGSRAAFGLLPPETLDLPRADSGRSLRAHMAELGLRPEAVARGETLLDPKRIHGFVEMHIEQGPTLEASEIPVAFVTAISGSFRYRKAACFGRYGHSGAVARSERSDAVFALADLIAGLDTLWGALEREGFPRRSPWARSPPTRPSMPSPRSRGRSASASTCAAPSRRCSRASRRLWPTSSPASRPPAACASPSANGRAAPRPG